MGKAFGGECWKCGKKGHMALECRSAPAALVEQQIQEVEIETVVNNWPIGMVSANRAPTKISNRFESLEPQKVELDPNRLSAPENDNL